MAGRFTTRRGASSDLMTVEGISAALAETIYDHFHEASG